MPIFKSLSIVMVGAILLNAIAPALVYAATYLQGTEVNANTLVQDAYVQVTYYDSNGEQKLKKGWVYAIDETKFEIRSRAIFGKETIAYDKVVSIIMSDETNKSVKQINEVDRFMRKREIEQAKQDRLQAAIQKLNQKPVTVMVHGQIDSSQIPWNWYVHVVYTSKGKKGNATGRIVNKTANDIIILNNQQYWKIAYNDIDTLRIAKNMRDIERYRELGAKYNARVRVHVPSIQKKRMVGELVKMIQDTLIIQSGRTFFQVPSSSISNFEVSIGRYRNTNRGAKTGLSIGLGILAIAFWKIYRADDETYLDGGTERDWASFELMVIGFPAAVLSTLTGTILGAISKSDKWVEVSPQRLNLSIAPTSTKGLRAALSFNF